MSSDIFTCFNSDNLVDFSFIRSFDHHYPHNEFLLQAVSEVSSPEDLPLPQLHDPPSQFQEPLMFSSYFAGYGDAREGSMQRSYSSGCTGTRDKSHVYRGGCGEGEGLIWRRVYSTGDLQKRGERYSTEERKERIRKYREKRNFRNFNKTINYACRKTLADSRPRIHGRFTRNEVVVGDGDASNDIAITLPTLRGHDHCHVESSSLWRWDHPSKEYNYGYVKGGEDALATSLFLPQNYY